MDIFSSKDYKIVVNNLISAIPGGGRGEYKKISKHLEISSVLVSQIFKGSREITLEQAYKLCDYFGFIELEKRYFLLLVNFSRSGNFELRKFYEKQIKELQLSSKKIINRVKHTDVLTEEQKATFYSDWRYSAIRLACDLKGISTTNDLQELFQLPKDVIAKYLDFLLETGLILKKSGKFSLGPSSTHLSKDSPFIKNHHRNWRLKAIESIDLLSDSELMYTAPMSVSKEVFEEVHQKLLKLIDELVQKAQDCESESMYYLNIDLRKLSKAQSIFYS